MPELPEVEVVRRGISPVLSGQPLRSVWASGRSLRSFTGDARLLSPLCGQLLRAVSRRSKTLVFDFDHRSLRLHLGMSGVLRISPLAEFSTPPQDPHVHLALRFERSVLWLRDPRRFGDVQLCTPADEWPESARGLEPLEPEFSGAMLAQAACGVRQAVKPWLMSGRVVVGVGNIYASEALFRAQVHPMRAAGRISRARWDRLAEAIQVVLREAIERGGSTLRDFRGHTGEPGDYREAHQVYGREGLQCPQCSRPIRRMVQAQRSTFFCSGCQR
ncbi:MAG: bifunctional DNA-formamidopyrimidine glycosylase/DNA-(apurinic or apyrimidinic site) lyase [Pseudomonadota bacterium]|jgi:formamidopyrimidine-DNA glycosylase